MVFRDVCAHANHHKCIPTHCGLVTTRDKQATLTRHIRSLYHIQEPVVILFRKGDRDLALLSKVFCELDQFLQIIFTDGGLLRAQGHQHVALRWNTTNGMIRLGSLFKTMLQVSNGVSEEERFQLENKNAASYADVFKVQPHVTSYSINHSIHPPPPFNLQFKTNFNETKSNSEGPNPFIQQGRHKLFTFHVSDLKKAKWEFYRMVATFRSKCKKTHKQVVNC